MDSQAAYLYREDGTRGTRAFVYPRFMLPLHVKNYLFIEPSAGVSETLYYVDRFDPADSLAAGGDRTLTREAFDFRLDLFSEISRVYNVSFLDLEKVHHRLRPQITYEYVPSVDQDEYPEFDDIDRIDPKNLITYALVNTFTSRRAAAASETSATAGGRSRSKYKEWGRFKIEQSYDIREQRADSPDEFADGENRRPFSPISAELDIFPGRYVSLSAETAFCTYESSFLTHSLGAAFEDNRGDQLALDYYYYKGGQAPGEDDTALYDGDRQETITAAALVKITEKLFVDGQIEHNFEAGETTRTQIGLLFQQQCWSVRAGYENDDDDQQFGFTVLLHGLGEFGQTF
jgi:LPS-assembly protein